MINRLTSCFFVVAILLFSCGKDSACFKGTGKIIKEQRLVSAEITHIDTQDNIDIVLTQSNTPALSVEGGANLLPYVNTAITGNTLTISSDNKCTMFRDNSIPITVYLSIPNINRIDYTGKGNVTSTNVLNLDALAIESRGGTGSFDLNINVNEFSIGQHSGPADFTITGVVENAQIYTLGSGWFFLKDCLVKNMSINQSGIGDLTVNVSNNLDVQIGSSGNLFYYGNPNVDILSTAGTGQIIKR